MANEQPDPGWGPEVRSAEQTSAEPEPEAEPGPPRPEEGNEAEARAQEMEERWHRALADRENLRKRHVTELARAVAAERGRVAEAWLPVVDNLDLALGHADSQEGAFVEGVRAVREQAVGILARLGYPRYGEAGVPFDPLWHEVVEVRGVSEVPAGRVLEVLRPGYGTADQQLRPAAVAVSGETAEGAAEAEERV
ncbi:nucleotide exchange factor GrpE [Streptomonospora wellingtoniae]|uniref:Protein GrpE n=1 Tax=Streptomonospora wellingtoniae TaxID=3075544 RepID=A0ABU2KQ14_9ACTN|nr:nucleotide exchange factor GrpE [Streptomonospora sp. DSM 45055]MDT0301301.1 nucleotide exchange factor GrpE [Streptomonospora sp. DSM 45055]